MKALTLWQPWAHAVCYLGKRVENREWCPRQALIPGQRFAIHAGQHVDTRRLADLGVRRAELVVGAVVATALFAKATHEPETLPEGQGVWWQGPYGWMLEEVRVLREPVPCRGWPGLWWLPLPVARRVQELGG